MSLPRFSVRRRITILMATSAIVVFGWFSLNRLEIKLLPDLTYPTLTIRTEIPGASPEEVENLISRPIEETLSVVENLQMITSTSMAGLSDVVIEFQWNTDLDKTVLDVREKLDALELPDESEKPSILRYNPESEAVMKIALTGEDLVQLRNVADKEIKPRLESLEGVASAHILGGEEEEIRIDLNPNEIAAKGISFQIVAQRLREENINMPGGILEEADAHYLVRTMNEFVSEDDIGNIIIRSDANIEVRLKDIASIHRTLIDKTTITHLSGKESVEIDIFKEGDANIITVADLSRALIEGKSPLVSGRRETLESLLPDNAELRIISDQSRFIKAAINEVQQAALIGCILAIFVLYLFLRNIPHTFTVAAVIPISIIATFMLMYFKKISLNLMSLGGLALGIGMLVDNAIVVLENIFRKKEIEPDASSMDIAADGASEVATAVTAATLTTVAVFFPIVFVSGIAGQIFQDLAWTVAFSLLASLIAALSLIPMASSFDINRKAEGIMPLWLSKKITNYREFLRNSDSFWILRICTSAVKVIVASFSDAGIWLKKNFHDYWKTSAIRNPVLRWFFYTINFPLRLFFYIVNVFLHILGFLILNCMFFFILIFWGSIHQIWRFTKFVASPILNLFDIVFEKSKTTYVKFLRSTIKNPVPLLTLTLIIIVITFTVIFPQLGMNLIPTFSQGEMFIDVEMPVGTPLSETEKMMHQVESLIMKFPEIEHVSAIIGSTSGDLMTAGLKQENLATVHIVLKSNASSKQAEESVSENIRDEINTLPGIESYTFRKPTLFSLKTPLEIELRGNDLSSLLADSNRLVEHMDHVPEFTDVYSTLEPGYPEIQIRFDRLKLARLGLTPNDVADVLKFTVEGFVPTEYGESGDEIDIRVRGERGKHLDTETLKYLVINPGSPSPVTLNSVAEIRETIGPSEIRRIDQRRVALVRADVRFLDLKHAIQKIDTMLKNIKFSEGVSAVVVGQSIEMTESINSLKFALILAVFLVYLVMASQFESLLHPFIILFSIPLAVFGVMIGLWLLNIPLSVIVFIGMIVLAGIVVNNAIVLIDAVNQLRSQGYSSDVALITAGSIRFRPILMTALTTILGLLPMALDTGPGSEIRIPLSVTIIFGLITSTFLTLIIIPVLYSFTVRKT
ncbi:efflux RND transporter permease subunit [bacterium]|nr:efflux RND transporter permease subunit [candidate division CSSED10-310 bacterium]